MSVRGYLNDVISKDKAAHLTLIDPDEQTPEAAGKIASSVDEAGTDAFMVGGSTSAEGEILDETVREIKRNSNLPTILFPGGQRGVSREADAIFFMSLLNSRNPYYITRAQMMGAPIVKKYELEPISMAYLIVEPGGTVGEVGEADLIPRDDTETAVNYSLASQYFGMGMVYLEAGSGAEKPVPTEMVEAVRGSIDSTLIVGGGIRTPELASERVDAGAQIIVTGTLVERAEDKFEKINRLTTAMKE